MERYLCLLPVYCHLSLLSRWPDHRLDFLESLPPCKIVSDAPTGPPAVGVVAAPPVALLLFPVVDVAVVEFLSV